MSNAWSTVRKHHHQYLSGSALHCEASLCMQSPSTVSAYYFPTRLELATSSPSINRYTASLQNLCVKSSSPHLCRCWTPPTSRLSSGLSSDLSLSLSLPLIGSRSVSLLVYGAQQLTQTYALPCFKHVVFIYEKEIKNCFSFCGV